MPKTNGEVTEQQKKLIALLRTRASKSDTAIAKILGMNKTRFYRVGKSRDGFPMRIDEYFRALNYVKTFYTFSPEQINFFNGQEL